MRAQKVRKTFEPSGANAEIEGLRMELAAFNERIEELERLEDRGTQGKRIGASAAD